MVSRVRTHPCRTRRAISSLLNNFVFKKWTLQVGQLHFMLEIRRTISKMTVLSTARAWMLNSQGILSKLPWTPKTMCMCWTLISVRSESSPRMVWCQRSPGCTTQPDKDFKPLPLTILDVCTLLTLLVKYSRFCHHRHRRHRRRRCRHRRNRRHRRRPCRLCRHRRHRRRRRYRRRHRCHRRHLRHLAASSAPLSAAAASVRAAAL